MSDCIIKYMKVSEIKNARIDREAPTYGRNADGYGSKIPTSRWVLYQGRWRRLYACCFSNGVSTYIVVCGEDLYMGPLAEEKILELTHGKEAEK